MSAEKYEPDKRWRHRYDKIMDAIESLEADLQQLATLDCEATPAVWSEYATEAGGCVAGAKALLMDADNARDAHIKKV